MYMCSYSSIKYGTCAIPLHSYTYVLIVVTTLAKSSYVSTKAETHSYNYTQELCMHNICSVRSPIEVLHMPSRNCECAK